MRTATNRHVMSGLSEVDKRFLSTEIKNLKNTIVILAVLLLMGLLFYIWSIRGFPSVVKSTTPEPVSVPASLWSTNEYTKQMAELKKKYPDMGPFQLTIKFNEELETARLKEKNRL